MNAISKKRLPKTANDYVNKVLGLKGKYTLMTAKELAIEAAITVGCKSEEIRNMSLLDVLKMKQKKEIINTL